MFPSPTIYEYEIFLKYISLDYEKSIKIDEPQIGQKLWSSVFLPNR